MKNIVQIFDIAV